MALIIRYLINIGNTRNVDKKNRAKEKIVFQETFIFIKATSRSYVILIILAQWNSQTSWLVLQHLLPQTVFNLPRISLLRVSREEIGARYVKGKSQGKKRKQRRKRTETSGIIWFSFVLANHETAVSPVFLIFCYLNPPSRLTSNT